MDLFKAYFYTFGMISNSVEDVESLAILFDQGYIIQNEFLQRRHVSHSLFEVGSYDPVASELEVK